MKKVTSIYLDEDLVEEVKRRNLSLSRLVCELLRDYLFGSAVEASYKLKFLQKQLRRLENRIESIERTLDALKKDKQRLLVEIDEQKEIVAKAERSARIAQIMRQIRTLAASVDYHVDESWKLCRSLVTELAKLGFEIDYEWFAQHMRRLQLFG